MRQLAKKLESSISTAKYIKQASNEPQATQVHLLRHQHTALPPNKHQRNQRKSKPKPFKYRYQQEEKKMTDHHKNMINTDQNRTNKQKDVISVVTHPTWKVLDVLPVDINASTAVR